MYDTTVRDQGCARHVHNANITVFFLGAKLLENRQKKKRRMQKNIVFITSKRKKIKTHRRKNAKK